MQVVCALGHVSEFAETVAFDKQEIAYIDACPKGVNGPNGQQVPCGARATWRRNRPEVKHG